MKTSKVGRAILGLATAAAMLIPASSAPAVAAVSSVSAATVAPILLIVNNTGGAPFGDYLGEILRYEGLNLFERVELSSLTGGQISQYPLAILAETALTAGQATLMTNYVSGGGRLIAFRPDAQIKSLFGLGAASGPLADGYLKMTASGAVNGVQVSLESTDVSLQLHAPADRYALEAASTEIGRLYSDATTPTAFPAIAAKGRAVAFTYDLGRAVAGLRQGRSSGLSRTGVPVSTTHQLYDGWLDLNRSAVMQADEQTRLFASIIEALMRSSGVSDTAALPLPRTWYFPQGARSVLMVTADAHANPYGYFAALSETVKANGANASIFTSIGDDLSNGRMNEWRAAGHSAGVLMGASNDDITGAYVITNLTDGFETLTGYFLTTYAISPSLTYRTALNGWEGWSRGAEIAANAGYKMDLNAFHNGPWLRKPDGTWARGHLTGGGRPIQFVSPNGALVPVFQQPTQLVDIQLTNILTTFEALSPIDATAPTRKLIDDSVNGNYAAIGLSLNIDYAYPDTLYWVSDTLRYAKAKGVPSYTTDQWLAFTEARHSTRYSNVTWTSGNLTLAFSMSVNSTAGVSIPVMLPPSFGGGSVTGIAVDGQPVAFTVDVVKQTSFVFFNVAAANHSVVVSYTPDTPLSGLSATNSGANQLFKPIVFTATLASGSNATYVWTFGDGAFGAGRVVTHTYSLFPSSGFYDVSVRATNGLGTLNATTRVGVSLPPVAYLPLMRKALP